MSSPPLFTSPSNTGDEKLVDVTLTLFGLTDCFSTIGESAVSGAPPAAC